MTSVALLVLVGGLAGCGTPRPTSAAAGGPTTLAVPGGPTTAPLPGAPTTVTTAAVTPKTIRNTPDCQTVNAFNYAMLAASSADAATRDSAMPVIRERATAAKAAAPGAAEAIGVLDELAPKVLSLSPDEKARIDKANADMGTWWAQTRCEG